MFKAKHLGKVATGISKDSPMYYSKVLMPRSNRIWSIATSIPRFPSVF